MILKDSMNTIDVKRLAYPSAIQSVEFLATKLVPHELSWINNDLYNKFFINYEAANSDELKKLFLEHFSYAIPGGETFSELSFIHAHKEAFFAERYGGRGVGTNGGGVRCGTRGMFQVKGIGKNPLAGEVEDTWHSYGGLHASDAIYEAVYSYILDRIMPLGVVGIYGIITTGRDASYVGCEELEKGIKMRTWGALLVREATARPAHYLRTPLYKPEPGSEICDDHTRVKLVNRELLKHFGSIGSYIQFLGKFLSGCANQFAFARMARIMHGSVTPSNLCMDGRWLDLTNSTFIGSGANVAAGAVPFYDEPMAALLIIDELLYTFSKYNFVDLDQRVLMDYYMEQFHAYLSLHLCYIFSWDYDQIPEEVKNNELPLITRTTNDLIVKVGDSVETWPSSLGENDSVFCLLKGLLIYEIDRDYGFTFLLRKLGIPKENLSSICSAYVVVVTSTNSSATQSWTFFCDRAVRALKRCLYNEFFFKGRFEQHLNTHVIDSESGLFKELVEDLIWSADWIFNESREKVVLFSSEDLEIVFSTSDAQVLVVEKGELVRFGSFKEFRNELLKAYKYNLVFSGYDFRVPLLEILEIMSHAEEIRTNDSSKAHL